MKNASTKQMVIYFPNIFIIITVAKADKIVGLYRCILWYELQSNSIEENLHRITNNHKMYI